MFRAVSPSDACQLSTPCIYVCALYDVTEKLAVAKQMEAEAEPPEDPLARTGRPFGGMIKDIKKRFPLYVSDIKDGLNMQCVSVFVFIYFAALSPAITLGGLLSE